MKFLTDDMKSCLLFHFFQNLCYREREEGEIPLLESRQKRQGISHNHSNSAESRRRKIGGNENPYNLPDPFLILGMRQVSDSCIKWPIADPPSTDLAVSPPLSLPSLFLFYPSRGFCFVCFVCFCCFCFFFLYSDTKNHAFFLVRFKRKREKYSVFFMFA